MKKKLDFDKVKNKVKSYFADYANELKSDKKLFKRFFAGTTKLFVDHVISQISAVPLLDDAACGKI